MWTDAHGLQDMDTPRALDTSEIPASSTGFAQATRNALEAGFDGVELHAASGYLPMQFLSTGTNKRTDGYGGSVQNRIRFVVETLEAMSAAAGEPGKVGHEDQPGDPVQRHPRRRPDRDLHSAGQGRRAHGARPTCTCCARRRSRTSSRCCGRSIPARSRPAAPSTSRPAMPRSPRALADFIVFGKPFTSNPDLAERFAGGLELTPVRRDHLLLAGPEGLHRLPAGRRAKRVAYDTCRRSLDRPRTSGPV